jgi:hypothetical protein
MFVVGYKYRIEGYFLPVTSSSVKAFTYYFSNEFIYVDCTSEFLIFLEIINSFNNKISIVNFATLKKTVTYDITEFK